MKIDLCSNNSLVFANDPDGFHIFLIENKENPKELSRFSLNETTSGYSL